MTSANRTLVVMAKAPRLGSVKTRLAESLSMQAVTELYRCLLNDTIALTQALDHLEIAVMCPASDVDDLSRAVAKTVRIVPQTGQGLAAGLASVFNHFATAGHCLQQRQPAPAGISTGDRVRRTRSPRPGCRAHARRRLLSCRCEGVPFRSVRQ